MSKVLKWKDGTIGIVAIILKLGGELTFAFAVSSLMMRLGKITH